MTVRGIECLEEAGEWVVRLQAESVPAEEVAEWVRWCEARPENLQAFERLQGGWDVLDALKGGTVSRASERSSWRRPALGLGLAACLATALVLIFHDRESADESALKALTASEINRSATLPDGSSLVLSARTFVNVDYNGVKRHLELSKGEAFFRVQADRKHPFEVSAGEVTVTALGTAFDVRRDDDRIVVTVEEGMVEVAGEESAGSRKRDRWRATAGYQVTWDRDERTARIALVDAATELRWREGQMAYLWEPLGLVVDDLNRHSQRRIVIRDAAIADLRYTGNVIPASIEDWVAAVTATYPVRAITLANGDIALESNPR